MPYWTNVSPIKRFVNKTSSVVTVKNPEADPETITIPPNDDDFEMMEAWDVPWAWSEDRFEEHHIEITIPGRADPICIWQHKDDGEDAIRYSTDGRYYGTNGPGKEPAMIVEGDSKTAEDKEVEILPDMVIFETYRVKGRPQGPPRFG